MTHPAPPIRAVVVDQDEHERACIKRLLLEHDIDVLGEASDCAGGLALIRQLSPDVLILDVRLGEMTGFELLDALEGPDMPHAIFVAQHEEDAAKAFEYHAVDYVVKPCTDERFGTALTRARERVLHTNGRSLPHFLERIVVRSRDRMFVVKLDDITWIEAAADYVHIHANGKRHIMRARISDLERRLDPNRFLRIHRSTIVNLDRISELRPLYHGEFQVVLKDNTELTLSRGYRGRLSQFFMSPI